MNFFLRCFNAFKHPRASLFNHIRGARWTHLLSDKTYLRIIYYLRVNKILEKKGLTPYWLGKQTGISQNNILKICNGETSTIRFDTIEKICKALECSINDLFESDNPQMNRLLTYTSKINELNNKDKSDT